MTFSGIVALGAAATLAAAAAAAAIASPAAAVGVQARPALHSTFRQASAIPPELLVGKQPPGFFPPGTEPTPVPQQAPSPTASMTPSPSPSMSAGPTPSMSAAPSPSMTPTPVATAVPSPVASPTPMASPSMTPSAAPSAAPTVAPSSAPTAAPSAAPGGGAMTPTRERVRVIRSGGKLIARSSGASCVLTTYDGYRPRVTTRRPVVYVDAAGKKMAMVSLKRRSSCVIPQGDLTKGAPTGVVHGGKVYASLGPAGEGGWCEAGPSLFKEAVSSARKSSRSLRSGVKVYVYTEGDAMCDLVASQRQPEEDD